MLENDLLSFLLTIQCYNSCGEGRMWLLHPGECNLVLWLLLHEGSRYYNLPTKTCPGSLHSCQLYETVTIPGCAGHAESFCSYPVATGCHCNTCDRHYRLHPERLGAKLLLLWPASDHGVRFHNVLCNACFVKTLSTTKLCKEYIRNGKA